MYYYKPKINITMKQIILLLTLIIFSLNTFAQEEKPASKSKAILFQQKEGSLLKREFYDVEGKKVGVGFQALVVTDEITAEKIGALRIKTYYYSSALKNSETFIGTLDSDELDACIKSLEYMSETIITQTPNTYTECEYKYRDGVSITVFSTSDNTKWQIAIQTKSYTNRSTSYLKISSLPEIINYLKNGQQLLKEKLSR